MNPRPPPLDPVAGVDLAHEARFQLGRTEVRPATLELVRDGVSATVERKVMQALVVLARRPGEVTSRDELVEHVWSGRFIGEDAIHRVIAKLRQAAEAHCGGDFALDTIPRVGYRLVVGGERDAAGPAAGASRWRPGRRTWIAAAAALVLAVAGAAAIRWWPQPAPSPPVVRLVGLTALGPDVPAALPARMTDDMRAAFGEDNVVILRERDPDFVLNGNVQRVGDKLQLSVRLEDSRDGTMLWSGVREWPAVERVSPRFYAVKVTQVVRCGLLDGATGETRLPPHALALFLQFCEARWAYPFQLERALTIARRLVQQQPGFARGWSSLAEVSMMLEDSTQADAAALHAEAKAAAARALRLDPRNAQADGVLAFQLPPAAYVERERLIRKAADGRLSACGCELIYYAAVLTSVGRTREAVVQYRRAHQHEPLGTHLPSLSRAYADAGDVKRSDEAFAAWSEVSADLPDFLPMAMQRAAYMGRWSEAARLAVTGAQPPSHDALIAAFEALASGEPARMAAARPGIEKVAAVEPDLLFHAVILAALGDRPAALDKLERIDKEYWNMGVFQPAILAGLRHEPRYLQQLETRGLIKYWRETHTRPDLCAAPDPPAFCKTL